MARPTKQGIDYFPLDVQFDDKTELYLADAGATGLAVLVTIWQLIYQNKGYYIENNEDLSLLIRRRLMADIGDIQACVDKAVRREVFDSKMECKYKILTSRAIQKRYFDAAKKKKNINVDGNYILSGINVGENAVYSSENSTNVNVEVKVKEKVKVNKTGLFESYTFDTWPHVPDEEIFNAWITAKKKAKGSVSQTAINTIGKEITKAVQAGLTVNQCLEKAESAGWKGFEASWVTKDRKQTISLQDQNYGEGIQDL